MATTTQNKKMSFSIENLAKSSRTGDSGDSYGTYFFNRNPWQDGDVTNHGDLTTNVYTSPYYTNNIQISPSISQVQFNSSLSNLRDSFRLSPDEGGYSFQNRTPSISGICQKRTRIDAEHNTNNVQLSPSISQVQFNSPLSNLRDSFRLSPDDDGYSSQNSTPSVSGSCQKRMRIDADVDVPKNRSSSATGSSMKRKRLDTDVDNLRDRRVTQVQSPNERLIDSSFESTCPASDSDEGIGETPRPKKARTAFSNDQIQALEVRYQSQKYLPAGERSKLATELGFTDQQVKTWFQNRRMKEKRKQKDDAFTGSVPLPTGGVDISQLHALGIPCPPPYTINNKHQQMMRDDSVPNFPLSSSSSQSPMFRTTQPVPFYSRFQPMTNSIGNSPCFPSSTNQLEGYR